MEDQSQTIDQEDFVAIGQISENVGISAREAAQRMLGLAGHIGFANEIRYLDNDEYEKILIYYHDAGKMIRLLEDQIALESVKK